MDKMREDFEAWAISDMGYMVTRAGDGYKCDYMNTAWLSWKASRAALCVELPYDETCEVEDDWDLGYFEAVSFYNQQLENLGVTLK